MRLRPRASSGRHWSPAGRRAHRARPSAERVLAERRRRRRRRPAGGPLPASGAGAAGGASRTSSRAHLQRHRQRDRRHRRATSRSTSRRASSPTSTTSRAAPQAQFAAGSNSAPSCPAGSAVGAAVDGRDAERARHAVPADARTGTIYNLEPPAGSPAAFGIDIAAAGRPAHQADRADQRRPARPRPDRRSLACRTRRSSRRSACRSTSTSTPTGSSRRCSATSAAVVLHEPDGVHPGGGLRHGHSYSGASGVAQRLLHADRLRGRAVLDDARDHRRPADQRLDLDRHDRRQAGQQRHPARELARQVHDGDAAAEPAAEPGARGAARRLHRRAVRARRHLGARRDARRPRPSATSTSSRRSSATSRQGLLRHERARATACACSSTCRSTARTSRSPRTCTRAARPARSRRSSTCCRRSRSPTSSSRSTAARARRSSRRRSAARTPRPRSRRRGRAPRRSTSSGSFSVSWDGRGAPCQRIFQPSMSTAVSNAQAGASPDFTLVANRPDRNVPIGRMTYDLPAGPRRQPRAERARAVPAQRRRRGQLPGLEPARHRSSRSTAPAPSRRRCPAASS